MERRRTELLVAMLLLCSVVVGLWMVPSLTASTPTMHVDSAETTVTDTYVGMSTYLSSTEGPVLGGAPLNIPPKVVGFMAPAGECGQYTLPFTVTSGTILDLGLISSSKPANVYLLSTYTFGTSLDGCSVTAPALVAVANFTSYVLHWTAPVNGTFYVILTGPTTMVTLTDQGSTQPVYEMATETYAVSTQTSFEDFLSTSTVTYTSTALAQPVYLRVQSDLAAVFVVITCLGLAVVAAKRRR